MTVPFVTQPLLQSTPTGLTSTFATVLFPSIPVTVTLYVSPAMTMVKLALVTVAFCVPPEATGVFHRGKLTPGVGVPTYSSAGIPGPVTSFPWSEASMAGSRIVGLLAVVFTPLESEREVSTTAASGLMTVALLVGRVRLSDGQLSAVAGSATWATVAAPELLAPVEVSG